MTITINKQTVFGLLATVGLSLSAIAAPLQAVHAQEATEAADGDVAITLERTACFGVCPVYTLTIYEDGTVVYEGENHVEVMGTQTFEIDPATVDQIVDAFADAGYFEWDDTYDM